MAVAYDGTHSVQKVSFEKYVATYLLCLRGCKRFVYEIRVFFANDDLSPGPPQPYSTTTEFASIERTYTVSLRSEDTFVMASRRGRPCRRLRICIISYHVNRRFGNARRTDDRKSRKTESSGTVRIARTET